MSTESVENELEKLNIKHYDFNQFKEFENIGVGAFANVYRAKLIDPKLIDANLGTEHVALTTSELDSKLSYVLVLEFADSGTLRNYFQKNQSLSLFDKLHLAQQLAYAINHMHSADVVHRDLHSNSILVHHNNIKISDFGISSLGVLLWEISSLHPPFETYNNTALYIHKLIGGREVPVEGTLPQYSALFTECWQDDPGQRPKIDKVMSELKEKYEKKLEQFKVFYSTFCLPSKVVDLALDAYDVEEKLKKLSCLQSNFLPYQYLEHYEDVIMKAADLYESANSNTFTNVYETYLSQITDEVNVNYVINTLIPVVRDEHRKTFKNYKEKKWMQIKYSEAFPLWKGVTDIKAELELINKVSYHLFVDLLEFLQTVAEQAIKNFVNDVDDFFDEQEAVVSLLTQVKQLRNISNRVEVTKEKIQNAVLIGIYTFEKDDINVKLVYQVRKADYVYLNALY
ncbi:kinase-like domain-containing protein [Gigaspora margarita]|uniref:Kinase-like domain-containing protein n=1 Tax=Gigaspora margarita TaxID=4874 RepID=A0A8H4EU17_GIGMA|nr:kinase-like domain-containing protein [Gigaspora margarita]